MGIQGFTKFIEDRAHLYLENYELRDCTLIVDGHSISCNLYNWKHWQFDARSNNCFGGDYDKYAYIVKNFFGMLSEARVRPIVVFDGGFEQRKLPTILKRMQDKIKIADKLNPGFEVGHPNRVVYPLFLRETFKDILRNLDVEMVMCEYEGDSEIAGIAKMLNCPVLSFDSDYFLFGVQYISFKTLDSRVHAVKNWRTGTYKCISCKVYRIEKFLENFRGLQVSSLHLLPVLLGNDYISQIVFRKFLLSIKVDGSMQDKIQLIVEWLKNETPESAIQMIIKDFKTLQKKLTILGQIEKIISGYYCEESQMLKYLKIEGNTVPKYCKKIDFNHLREIVNTENEIDRPVNCFENETDQSICEITPTNELDEANKTISPTQNEESPENGHYNKAMQNGETSSSKIQSDELQTQLEEPPEKSGEEEDDEEMQLSNTFTSDYIQLAQETIMKTPISKLFQKNFAECLYPSSFMDILTQNKYYCIPQVENHLEENSHVFSYDIVRAIHKILTGSGNADFTIVARDEGTTIKWFPQEQYTIPVPSLEEIEQLPLQGRREVLFRILNIDNSFVSLLEHFPTEWHTFLVALKFASSKTTFETPLIYSLILGFIILNYIDQRLGYFRSVQRFNKIYEPYMKNLPKNRQLPFRADKNCFYYFPNSDCIIFMQKVLHNFTVAPCEGSKAFDRHLIHQMAQIQSVLLHIKYLNSLLKNPHPNLIIHQIFDSTFIYNLTKTFQTKSAELENNYLNVFLKDCPCILAGLKYVLNMLNKQIIL